MKFLVDAQLPRRLANWLREAGHDAVYTLDLPEGNRTSDVDILTLVAREQRIVVTKDADFVNSFLLSRQPERLLLISTGNITNADLEAVLRPNLHALVEAFSNSSFVELTRSALVVHS